jgi:glutamine phosphoribosylpyrophosphate amidotransferase
MATTDPFDADHFHEECGVFAVYGHPDAAALTALGLHALQHRGQEATGIVAYDGEQFNAHRGLGQVSDNFSSKEVIGRLRGSTAIGHVRYATTGEAHADTKALVDTFLASDREFARELYDSSGITLGSESGPLLPADHEL